MLDRESTFAHPEIVSLLKSRFVPLAIDQAYQRRQQDTEGEFYRRIAGQYPRNNFRETTQGFYIATAAGELLLYNNNRDPEKVARLMKEKLAELASRADGGAAIAEIKADKVDPRYNLSPPEGGLVVRVRAKVVGGYEPTEDPWQSIFQGALSRDNLWISKSEHEALARGSVPASLTERITRFHLVDNTRGEPPMWKPEEIRRQDVALRDGRLTGAVRLQTGRGDRGFDADVFGYVETRDGAVVRFDVVVLGEFWGEGPFTGGAPKGRFPLAIAFTLADGSDVADGIPPQASRGWLQGYLK